jgi:hypothetical protein
LRKKQSFLQKLGEKNAWNFSFWNISTITRSLCKKHLGVMTMSHNVATVNIEQRESPPKEPKVLFDDGEQPFVHNRVEVVELQGKNNELKSNLVAVEEERRALSAQVRRHSHLSPPSKSNLKISPRSMTGWSRKPSTIAMKLVN